MITHVVLLKPKSETTLDEMQEMLAQVQALQQSIPGIVDVQVGENLSMSHQGYTYDSGTIEMVAEMQGK